jgi:dihydrofolate synthase/folylpolyglutamate synthase
MNYRDALAWLDSLESLGIRPGLDRIDRLLRRLGDPHRAFRSIHVAGTNGKGSTTAFLAAILQAAGLRPGVYTSPHLVRFEERIVVGDRMIDEDEVAALTAEVRAAIGAEAFAPGDHPTYFEATTALAFLHFRRQRVPLALLEVGMGGTYDATNVVTPLACAITRVAMDHTRWLGSTLPAIAGEKAGILKPGVPAVIARQEPEAMAAIQAMAERVGAPLLPIADCRVRAEAPLPDPPAFALTTPLAGEYPHLTLALRGAHQVDNAVVAVLLAEQLRRLGFEGVDAGAVTAGLARAAWPGRLEIVPGRPEILLDGAHNPSGCAVLADYLRDHQRGRRIALVFAVMKDKPADEMLGLLCPFAAAVFVTGLPLPRVTPPASLAAVAAARGLPGGGEVRATASIAEALPLARHAAGEAGLVVVSGSLYLVGEAKRLL